MPSLKSSESIRPTSTENAADELSPEPGVSVLFIRASNPPTSSPSSLNATTTPRMRDFGVPNSPVRRVRWVRLTSNGLNPSDCTRTMFVPFASHWA